MNQHSCELKCIWTVPSNNKWDEINLALVSSEPWNHLHEQLSRYLMNKMRKTRGSMQWGWLLQLFFPEVIVVCIFQNRKKEKKKKREEKKPQKVDWPDVHKLGEIHRMIDYKFIPPLHTCISDLSDLALRMGRWVRPWSYFSVLIELSIQHSQRFHTRGMIKFSWKETFESHTEKKVKCVYPKLQVSFK